MGNKVSKQKQPWLVDDYYIRNKSLFIEVNEGGSIQRLKVISTIYSKWIKHQQKAKRRKTNLNMFDVVENELGQSYNVQRFLKDYAYMVSKNRNAFQIDEDKEKERKSNDDDGFDTVCHIKLCFISNRNNRNRKTMTQQNNKRKQIFFIDKDDDDDDMTKSIMIQQILDSLHVFMYHRLTFDVNKYLNPDEFIGDDDDIDDIDIDIDIDAAHFDAAIKKITQIIDEKMKSNRFSKENNGRYNKENNKFITKTVNEMQVSVIGDNESKSMDDNIAIYQSAVYGNNALLLKKEKQNHKVFVRCGFDDVFKSIQRYKLNLVTINHFISFIHSQEYDTDALYSDVRNNPESTIIHELRNNIEDTKSVQRLCGFLLRFVFEKDRDKNVYSAGFRYFYWNYYQYKNNEWNVLCIQSNNQPFVEGNKGYKLKDWFIVRKYVHFKQEILNNEMSPFSKEQYDVILVSATEKRYNQIHDESAKNLKCYDPTGWMGRIYGIHDGDLIEVHHIMALMFYCSFSEHCFQFSASFRRINAYESDESLKQRHSEYHYWGRYLRECVECFGIYMEDSSIKMFYHGVSQRMLFESTTLRLNGPVSTTTDFIIANTVFGRNGVVLDITNSKGASVFFDCNFWSEFATENERLYIGGLQPVVFVNIHDIPNQIEYKTFIKLINICERLLRGYPLFGIKPTARDCSLLNTAIKEKMNECYLEKGYEPKIPRYSFLLFYQFVKERTDIEIDCFFWDHDFLMHNIPWDCGIYGFQKFRKIFIGAGLECKTFRFSLMIELCHNLENITIYNHPYDKFEASIHLDDAFVAEILKCISIIDEKPDLKCNKLQIVKPLDSIEAFISRYSKTFVAEGWILKQIKYVNESRAGKQCDETLLIEKV